MRKRLFIVTALWICFGFVVLRSAGGLEVDAQGRMLNEAGVQTGTWGGRFLIGGSRLEGSVAFSGVGPVSGAEIEGSVSGDAINFTFTESTPLPAFFTGRLSGKTVAGSFELAGQKGAWVGEWELSPGAPAPDMPVEPLAPRDAASIDEDRNLDPADPCSPLRSRRIMGVLSPGVARALREMCPEQQVAGGEAWSWRVALRQELQRRLVPYWQLAAYYFPSLAIAVAQTAPANTPINNSGNETFAAITQTSPSIAVSSSSDQNQVALFEDTRFGSGRKIGYATSTDTGGTWNDRGQLQLDNIGNPKVVPDTTGGTFLMVYSALGASQPFPPRVYSGKSTDNGATWSYGPEVSHDIWQGNTNDRPELVEDRWDLSSYKGRLYVCWTEIAASTARVRFARSTDHGNSFGSSVDLGEGSADYATNCSVTVGTDGRIYVAWWNFDQRQIRSRRSLDGGDTFGSVVWLGGVGSAERPGTRCTDEQSERWVINGQLNTLPQANLAPDHLQAGYIYATWAHYTSGSMEVSFNRSTNSGASWGTPVRLNDTTTNDQFLPRTVTTKYTSGGSVTLIRVIWHDRRLDTANPNKNFDVYEDYSSNSGQNWHTDARWTDTTSVLPQLNPHFDCAMERCIFSDNLALAGLAGSNVMAAWLDTRLTQSGTACGAGRPASSPDPDIRGGQGC